jgi:hypothetical protein
MKNMSEKKCSGCKLQLSIENFYKNKNMSDGHASYCIDCTKVNSKRYFQRKKAKIAKNENNNLLNAVFMSNINTSENQNAEFLMKFIMIEKMLKSVSEELEVLKNNYVKSEIMC